MFNQNLGCVTKIKIIFSLQNCGKIPFFIALSLKRKRVLDHILHTTFRFSFWGHHKETHGGFLNSYILLKFILRHFDTAPLNNFYTFLVVEAEKSFLTSISWRLFWVLLRFFWYLNKRFLRCGFSLHGLYHNFNGLWLGFLGLLFKFSLSMKVFLSFVICWWAAGKWAFKSLFRFMIKGIWKVKTSFWKRFRLGWKRYCMSTVWII